MKKKLLPIIVLASVLGMSTLVGCNQGGSTPTPDPGPVEPTEVKVTGVTLNKTEVSLEVGGTETLVATVAPSDATNKKVTWSSSDESVVAVAGGVLTAKKAGRAEITVKTEDGDFTAKATVTVTEPAPVEVKVTGVTLNKSEVSLFKGGSETLVATVAPADATNKNVTWKSSDTDVVTVADGVLTAVEIGEADITVKTADGGKTAKAHVVVTLDVKSITIGNTQEELAELEEGEDFTLKLTVDPEANVNQLLASGFLTIESSNKEVATTEGLKVFALKEGTAKITASLFGKTAELDISVARRIPNKEKYGTDHEGNAEDPFTNEDALKVAKAMEADQFPAVKEKYAFYIKGEVDSFYSSQLPGSNQTVCSWYLKPNSGTEKFEAYKIEKADGSKWAADDIWEGAITTFKATKLAVYSGQYETATGTLVKIEGEKPEPQKTIDATVAEALEVAGKLEAGKSTYDKYAVEGYITAVTTAWDSNYKNITFSIAAEEGGEQTISAYRCAINGAADMTDGELNALAAKLIIGAKVKVTGILTNYHGDTLQFAQGCVLDLIAEAEAKPLTGLDVPEKITLLVEGATNIIVKPVPASASLEGLAFESADSTIALVDAKGAVSGMKVGETTITVSVGAISATVAVKVIAEINYGTVENPLKPEEATDLVMNFASSGDLTKEELTVSGIISEVLEDKNGYKVFWLQSSDGEVARCFEIYQADFAEGVDKTKYLEGAEVVVKGFAKLYGTTCEITSYKNSEEQYVQPQILSISYDAPIPVIPEPTLVTGTCAEFFANEEGNGKQLYQLTGTVTKWVGTNTDGTKYGNFYIQDESGEEVYVYGATADATKLVWDSANGKYTFSNPQDFLTNDLTKQIIIGSTVTVKLTRCDYTKNEVTTKEGQGIVIDVQNDEPIPVIPEPTLVTGTCAEFFANEEGNGKQLYQLTGTVTKWVGTNTNATQYGNFYIQDESGEEVYVYGATATATALAWDTTNGKYTFTNPKDFLTNDTTKVIDIGDTVTVKLTRCDYTKNEVTTKEGQGIVVSVTPAPAPELEAITLNKTTLGLEEGAEYDLVASAFPNKAVLGEVAWESDHPEFATVDENGHVVAVAPGEATIKVSSVADNTIFAECVVTVSEAGGGGDPTPVSYDAVIAAGTNGSAATVNSISAIKVGTSKADGDMTVTVGAGATKLIVHIAAWKGTSNGTVAVAIGSAEAVNYDIKADNGITSNTPFTLEGNAEDFVIEIELSDITAETVITISSGSARRYVVWGATYIK